MRTLCKSGLGICTVLYPRKRCYYLLVESAWALAMQLPSWHPLSVDLPDSAAIVRLANLLKVCAYCDDPVQTEHSDQVNYGEMVACSALRISNWPFSEWLKLLPRSPHNLAHAPAYQTHHVTVWTCRNCRARLPAPASGSSASTSSVTAFSGVSEVSEVSESELWLVCIETVSLRTLHRCIPTSERWSPLCWPVALDQS